MKNCTRIAKKSHGNYFIVDTLLHCLIFVIFIQFYIISYVCDIDLIHYRCIIWVMFILVYLILENLIESATDFLCLYYFII